MKTATQRTASRPGQGASDGVLVDRHWLDARLFDPQVRVVEVDVSPAAYNDWHVDGAVLWNIYTDLKDAAYRPVGTAAAERLLARSGIAPGSMGGFYGYAPALGLWLMKVYGHADARILDCSRDTCPGDGHPGSTAPVKPASRASHLGAHDPRIQPGRAAASEATTALGPSGAALPALPSSAPERSPI